MKLTNDEMNSLSQIIDNHTDSDIVSALTMLARARLASAESSVARVEIDREQRVISVLARCVSELRRVESESI